MTELANTAAAAATAPAALYAAGYLVRSVAWAIATAGPEVRKWKKNRKRGRNRVR